MLTMQLFFAGIWAQVWHWGIGIGLIILCLAGAFFTTSIPIIGPYLTNARRDLLWAAFTIAIFLAGQWLGAHDEKRKHEARQVIIEQTVDKAVDKTKTPAAKGKPDRWDKPEN